MISVQTFIMFLLLSLPLQDEQCAASFGGEGEQQSDVPEHRKSSYRAVLEKKLSIAERAVAANPCCIALQLERLRICQELWEPSVLAKEWKKLVSRERFYVSTCLSVVLHSQSHLQLIGP